MLHLSVQFQLVRLIAPAEIGDGDATAWPSIYSTGAGPSNGRAGYYHDLLAGCLLIIIMNE
eukprot:1187318-Prorocentrum_minimum.AAC.2